MAVLMMFWVVLFVALPCVLAFLAAYRGKRRRMLWLIAALAIYCIVMTIGLYTEVLAMRQDESRKAWGAIYAMMLMFGGGGGALGLLVGGLSGWLLRGRL